MTMDDKKKLYKLCVFPNDSLKAYYDKGEVKPGYFNPDNLFAEIHVISLFDEEVNENHVSTMAGKAKLKIHRLGKTNISNYKYFEKKVITVIEKIKPDLIRSYNPIIQGYLAVKAGKKFNIPVVISVHTNYDQQRNFAKKQKKILKLLKSLLIQKKLEKFSLQNCNAVICVYQFIVPFVNRAGAKNVSVIYNKVNLEKFSPTARKMFDFKKPTIISVGRLIDQKNPANLIHAVLNLDVNLLIVGDGPKYQELDKLIKTLKIEHKVRMIKKVPNEDLPSYYASCDVYVQLLENLDGIPIPVFEAMACGLPVIISKHSNEYSEIVDDAVIFVDNTIENLRKEILELLNKPEKKKHLQGKSLETIKKISENMQTKELTLYKELMNELKKTTN